MLETSDWWEVRQRWKDEWKCVETATPDGAQYVTSSGLQPTVKWCVATWDSVIVKV